MIVSKQKRPPVETSGRVLITAAYLQPGHWVQSQQEHCSQTHALPLQQPQHAALEAGLDDPAKVAVVASAAVKATRIANFFITNFRMIVDVIPPHWMMKRAGAWEFRPASAAEKAERG